MQLYEPKSGKTRIKDDGSRSSRAPLGARHVHDVDPKHRNDEFGEMQRNAWERKMWPYGAKTRQLAEDLGLVGPDPEGSLSSHMDMGMNMDMARPDESWIPSMPEAQQGVLDREYDTGDPTGIEEVPTEDLIRRMIQTMQGGDIGFDNAMSYHPMMDPRTWVGDAQPQGPTPQQVGLISLLQQFPGAALAFGV